jgi:predicted ester cyclase
VEGFPDLRLTVEDDVGDGDLVAQRIHFEGTHTGVFQGLPPTGKKVAFEGLELNRHGEDGASWSTGSSWTLSPSYRPSA